MTLEVYLDGALKASETVDPATLATGRRTHRYQYAFGQVYLESSKTAPWISVDPASYSITWLSPGWSSAFPDSTTCNRGKFPCRFSSVTFSFTAEQRRGSSGDPQTVDTGSVEIEYDNPNGSYSHMLTAKIAVYFTTVAKTHLLFRDPRHNNRLINAGANGLVRDD